MKSNKKELSPAQRDELLSTLKVRFEKNMKRHKGIEWAKVQAKLEANPGKLWSVHYQQFRPASLGQPRRDQYRPGPANAGKI